jgi:hypothetical protein
MIKPIDRIDVMRPVRRNVQQSDGSWIAYVKAPPFMGTPEVNVRLTADQYRRYQLWRDGHVMIQEALPELSIDQREMLLSGLDNGNFRRAIGVEE